jgi:hypothetical protein
MAPEKQCVEERRQRCSVAADRQIPGPDVSDDGPTESLGDPRGLSDLQGSQGVVVDDPVVDGLAVGAHGVDPTHALGRVVRRVGERLTNEGVQLAHLGQRRGRRWQRRDETCPQLRVVRHGVAVQQATVQDVAVRLQIDDRHIDAVVRRA